MADANLTERQQKWFASVRAGLERDSGRTLAAWAEIARSCPETAHRARLKWLKDNHGLKQNHASLVLDEAFGAVMGWQEPDALYAALWTDAGSLRIVEAVSAAAWKSHEVIQTQRKGYTAWSRKVQFAALRPIKGGKAMLGLALAVDADARLEPSRNDGWSERLTARLVLASPEDVDAGLEGLLQTAWDRS